VSDLTHNGLQEIHAEVLPTLGWWFVSGGTYRRHVNNKRRHPQWRFLDAANKTGGSYRDVLYANMTADR
jgi:hypothetical protein